MYRQLHFSHGSKYGPAVSADVETNYVNERVRLDKRDNSPRWQARIKLASGEWHRFSTKTTDLEKSTEAALKYYFAAEERLKNKLPQKTRRFKQVAEYACERMRNELASGALARQDHALGQQ